MTRTSRSEKTLVCWVGFRDSYWTAQASHPFLSVKLNNTSSPESKIGSLTSELNIFFYFTSTCNLYRQIQEIFNARNEKAVGRKIWYVELTIAVAYARHALFWAWSSIQSKRKFTPKKKKSFGENFANAGKTLAIPNALHTPSTLFWSAKQKLFWGNNWKKEVEC